MVHSQVSKNKNIKKNKIINVVSTNIVTTSIILMIICYVAIIFMLLDLDDKIKIFGLFYSAFGITASTTMLYWGALFHKNFELEQDNNKISNLLWWVNLLFNQEPVYSNKNTPLKDKKKGWYSGAILVILIVQFIFSNIIIFNLVKLNHFCPLFFITVISFVLLIINYIFSVIWEVSRANSNSEKFPFQRILIPLLIILEIAIVIYLCLLYNKFVIQ